MPALERTWLTSECEIESILYNSSALCPPSKGSSPIHIYTRSNPHGIHFLWHSQPRRSIVAKPLSEQKHPSPPWPHNCMCIIPVSVSSRIDMCTLRASLIASQLSSQISALKPPTIEGFYYASCIHFADSLMCGSAGSPPKRKPCWCKLERPLRNLHWSYWSSQWPPLSFRNDSLQFQWQHLPSARIRSNLAYSSTLYPPASLEIRPEWREALTSGFVQPALLLMLRHYRPSLDSMSPVEDEGVTGRAKFYCLFEIVSPYLFRF